MSAIASSLLIGVYFFCQFFLATDVNAQSKQKLTSAQEKFIREGLEYFEKASQFPEAPKNLLDKMQSCEIPIETTADEKAPEAPQQSKPRHRK